MVARSLALFAALTFGLAACSDDDPAPAKGPCDDAAPADIETCLSTHFFSGYDENSAATCAGVKPPTRQLDGRREVLFFESAGILDADLVTEGRFLQGYYAPYGLTFFTGSKPRATDLNYAMNGTNADISGAAAKVGLAAGASPTAEQQKELNRLVADIIYGGLRLFIKNQSDPPKSLVNIVVLHQIASPDVARQLKGVIGGLGLSPRLLRDIAADDPSSNLFELLSLPQEFTPTLFIGHSDIVALAKNPQVIVAHEMGHSLGLQHSPISGDLMHQGQASSTCTPGLDDAQLAQLNEAADRALDPALQRESWRVALDLHRSLVDDIVARNLARR